MLTAIKVWGISFFCYHLLEFIVYGFVHKWDIDFSDLFLNYKYILFQSISLIEHVILHSTIDSNPYFINLGILMVIFGSLVRLASIIQLKGQFSYLIKCNNGTDEKLLTTGLYSFVRHPGYCGFWFFVVGGQIVLGNCCFLIGMIVALKMYFEKRIHWEELMLKNRFGSELYVKYKSKVPLTGVPFVYSD